MKYTHIHVLKYIYIQIYSFLKQCRAKPNQGLTNLSYMPLWQHDFNTQLTGWSDP